MISGDTSNTLGGLTFTYQITNDASSPHALQRFTLNDFTEINVDASYVASGPVAPPR